LNLNIILLKIIQACYKGLWRVHNPPQFDIGTPVDRSFGGFTTSHFDIGTPVDRGFGGFTTPFL
jgi:hypothetical protein